MSFTGQKVMTVQVFEYIKAYRSEHGYAPSLRDVADTFGVSESTASFHIEKLADAGAIRRVPRLWRAIVVVKDSYTEPPRRRGWTWHKGV